MALVTYLIGYCGGGPAILVDFDSSSLPAVNGNYYLTFTGGTIAGCYDIIDNAEPSTGIDKVLTLSVDYGDCATCQAVVTPTPTNTQTLTQTPTNTPTLTKTPTNTPTLTKTPTPSVTTTKTPTPSVTTTQTGTPNVTPTNTVTKTPTPTPSVTTTQTGTPSVTTTNTPTPSVTTTNTGTPAVTPTNTVTKTPTPTQTGTPAVTPTNTPSPTPTTFYTGISVNSLYETLYIDCCEVSGTTIPSTVAIPHPVYSNSNGNGAVVQLNAVELGGFNGLNN
jgi:hypothetical protein